MTIIALTGYPRVGKNTFVDILKTIYPSIYIGETAFADRLKQLHMKKFGIADINTYHQYFHGDILYNNVNLRDDIALLSNEILAGMPYFNIDNVVADLIAMQSYNLKCITDLRYPLEAEFAKRHNIPIIRIDRGHISDADRIKPWNTHVETFNPRYVIDNNGTIQDYANNIKQVVDQILKENNHKPNGVCNEYNRD